MLDLIEKGGVLMLPIVLASVLGLALALERFIVLSRTKLPRSDEFERFLGSVRSGDTAAAEAWLGHRAGPVPAVLRAILQSGRDTARSEKAAALAGDEALERLNQRLPWLSVLGALVPLVGLLGTVVGMIRAFAGVAASGQAGDITILADGIWESLLTTAAALSVAIPVLLAHHALVARVDRIAFAMRQAGEHLLLTLEKGES